ncbi:UNVERIFIED_CONTAM: protein NLP5 [Sesamum radiatum]|uniref:Protein NLP5 n=1 Tax=Sesamum radiatum TaxID=300843 RepID=A0AAW2NBQ6_SESRA
MVPFWAPKVVPRGSWCLTTSDQPFALGTYGLSKGLCWYRKICMDHAYYLGEGAKEDEVGPPGRVFLTGYPESSPDLRLYSTKEHPLRDVLVSCGLRGFLALPVFDFSRTQCLGVLELLNIDYGSTERSIIVEQALQKAYLRSTHINYMSDATQNLQCKEPPKEIREMLELAVDAIPQLHLAQVWIPCTQCGHIMSCMERAAFMYSGNMKFNSFNMWDFMMRCFIEACNFQRRPDEGAKEEELGPLGRVFRHRCPESTPNFRLYSTEEFPQRDYAIQCGFRTYLALPIFNLHESECLGVLEWIDMEDANTGEPHTRLIRNALEGTQKINQDSALRELKEMLRKVIRTSQSPSVAQSSYTGSNLYILQFFLNLPSRKYEHLCSFLSFLLLMMKDTLKSFRVASGKQLGEELVVEVISLDKNDEFTEFELHQPDVLPVRFVVTQYVDKEPRCQHSTSQSVHDTPNRHDSSVGVPEAEPDDAASTDSEEGVRVTTRKTEGERNTTSFHISYDDLQLHFGKRLEDVEKALGVSRSTLKRACRGYGIKRWPSCQNNKKNPSLFETSTSNKRVRSSDQQVLVSSSNNPPPQISPVHNQNVLQTSGIESSQNHTKLTEDGFVLIKAKFGEDTVKLQLLLSSGIEKLKEEVGKRFNLMNGSFKLYYLDEDEWILLACDDDLQLCMKTSTASGKTPIQILVK